MLCGKQLILATKPFAKENRYKSWLYTLSTIAFIFLTFAGILFVCLLFTTITSIIPSLPNQRQPILL